MFDPYIHTASVTQKCERSIKIFQVLIFPLIALTHRVIASRLCCCCCRVGVYGPSALFTLFQARSVNTLLGSLPVLSAHSFASK